MKKIIITVTMLFSTVIVGMDEWPQMVVERPASLKFISAVRVATNIPEVNESQLPEEILELVKQIKLLISSKAASKKLKKLLINLINNPEIDLEDYFYPIVRHYTRHLDFNESIKKLDLSSTLRLIRQTLLDRILLRAANKGDMNLANLMVKLGADINTQDFTGYWWATVHHIKSVQVLLDPKRDINSKNNRGETALMWASLWGFNHIVSQLLEKGADSNIKEGSGGTALMWAIYGLVYHKNRSNSLKIIKMLIEAGTDINAKNSNGETALSAAIGCPKAREIVKMLISSNADVNVRSDCGSTPLMHAVEEGDKKIVKILLKLNADVNNQNKYGDTALMEVVHILSNKKVKRKEIIQILLDFGADINHQNKEGNTALITAVEYGRKDLIKKLLKAKADSSITNFNGKTALYLANEQYKRYKIWENEDLREFIKKQLIKYKKIIRLLKKYDNSSVSIKIGYITNCICM